MLQEKLNLLLQKYGVDRPAVIGEQDGSYTVTIGKKTLPILSQRFERRFTELKKMLHDGTLTGISVVRCNDLTDISVPLMRTVRRELDLCRFLTGREIVSLSAYVSGDRAVNILAVLDNDVNCIIEVANTLPIGTVRIDKHEVISARGLVCDRVVDTQIPQQSVYLYADHSETYTDVDFELYGLSVEQISAVRGALAMASSEDLCRETEDAAKVLDLLVACVDEAVRSGKKVMVKRCK